VEPAVAAVSPTFSQILAQCEAAKSQRLDQLEGIGLRKALEFLIKDYIVHKLNTVGGEGREARVEGVLAKPLAKCIKDHIDNERIKVCAERAVWLGNDETHYVRRWDDKDIEDLRRLIRLTQAWINAELLTDEAMREMPEGR
jgi:hypothetical protein